jgi:hypothetical protein
MCDGLWLRRVRDNCVMSHVTHFCWASAGLSFSNWCAVHTYRAACSCSCNSAIYAAQAWAHTCAHPMCGRCCGFCVGGCFRPVLTTATCLLLSWAQKLGCAVGWGLGSGCYIAGSRVRACCLCLVWLCQNGKGPTWTTLRLVHVSDPCATGSCTQVFLLMSFVLHLLGR